MRAKWQADDPDAFAAQEERRSSWRRAKRGGCRLRSPGSGELPGSSSVGDGHACLTRALAVRAIGDDLLYRVMVVSWLSVLSSLRCLR